MFPNYYTVRIIHVTRSLASWRPRLDLKMVYIFETFGFCSRHSPGSATAYLPISIEGSGGKGLRTASISGVNTIPAHINIHGSSTLANMGSRTSPSNISVAGTANLLRQPPFPSPYSGGGSSTLRGQQSQGPPLGSVVDHPRYIQQPYQGVVSSASNPVTISSASVQSGDSSQLFSRSSGVDNAAAIFVRNAVRSFTLPSHGGLFYS